MLYSRETIEKLRASRASSAGGYCCAGNRDHTCAFQFSGVKESQEGASDFEKSHFCLLYPEDLGDRGADNFRSAGGRFQRSKEFEL